MDTVLVGSVNGVEFLYQSSGSDQLFEDRPVRNVGKVRVSAFLICHRSTLLDNNIVFFHIHQHGSVTGEADGFRVQRGINDTGGSLHAGCKSLSFQ